VAQPARHQRLELSRVGVDVTTTSSSSSSSKQQQQQQQKPESAQKNPKFRFLWIEKAAL
jgi:hypothetical protein